MAENDVNEYLRANVGEALSQAYTALALAQPADAIDFLGTFLKQYSLAERMKEERKKEEEDRDEYRAMLVQANAKVEEAVAEKAAAAKLHQDRYDALLEAAASAPSWTAADDANFARSVKEQLGGEAGYLALVAETAEGGPELQYFAGQECMIDQVLKQSEGASFKAFEEVPAPEAVDGEEPAPHRPYQEVSVPCVTDDEAVKYFTWTKIGAYCGVPLVYNGYLTQEALDAFLAFEKENEGKEVAEGEEAPQPEAPSALVRMLVGVDTLGVNTALNLANAGKVHTLCDAVVSAKQRTEFQACWDQAKLLNASSSAAAQKTFDSDAGKKGDTKDRVDAWKEANEGQAVSDTKKALFEAESNYEVVAAAVKASGAELEQLQKFAVSAPEVTAALQAVVLAAGHESPDALKGGPYKTVDFGKVKTALAGFVASLDGVALNKPHKIIKGENKLAFYAALKTIDAAAALEKGGLPAYMLVKWLEAAIALRQAFLADVEAEYNGQKAAYDAAEKAAEDWELAKAAAEAKCEEEKAGGKEDAVPADVGEQPAVPEAPHKLNLVDGDFA